MHIPFSPPDISEKEIEYVGEVLRSGWITTGPKTKLLEEKLSAYCGVKRTACLASATAAMELALRVLGIGPGDEVITSAYTYTASCSVITHVGATPVLVDVQPDSVRISEDALRAAVTEKTKAIIPIDLGGVPADYDMLHRVLEEKKSLFAPNNDLQKGLGRVAIVADCAHSLGATYKGEPVARHADFSCFSFHAVKNFTTAEGGCVSFSDVGGVSADELYKQFMLWSLHGQSKDALAKTQIGAWEYDILMPAYKCNMTDIMAAIGLGQMERYEGMLLRRAEMVRRYNAHFEGTDIIPIAHEGEDFSASRHLYITRVKGMDEAQRNAVIIDLAEAGVMANVHYKPLPMMTAYKNLGFSIEDYPNAYGFYRNEITLPLHTLMTDEMVDYAAETMKRAVAARKG